jgi:hypothetical protein
MMEMASTYLDAEPATGRASRLTGLNEARSVLFSRNAVPTRELERMIYSTVTQGIPALFLSFLHLSPSAMAAAKYVE